MLLSVQVALHDALCTKPGRGAARDLRYFTKVCEYSFLLCVVGVVSCKQEQVWLSPAQLPLLKRKRRNTDGFCHLGALGSCMF